MDAAHRSTESSLDPVYFVVQSGYLFEQFASAISDDVIASISSTWYYSFGNCAFPASETWKTRDLKI